MPVTVGLTNAKFMEITSGIHEGDQVIYAGYENLMEGAPVVPTPWGPSGALSLPPATGEAAAGTLYTCPMHGQVRLDHPGDCPICGMRLQSVAPVAGVPASSGGTPATSTPTNAPGRSMAPPRGTVYTCPMHQQIVQDHPGKCPICHMNLVLKSNSSNATPSDGSGSMSGMGGAR